MTDTTASTELQKILARTQVFVTEMGHDFATPEHLLLALTEDDAVQMLLEKCNVDIQKLQEDLRKHLNTFSEFAVPALDSGEVLISAYERVLQRAKDFRCTSSRPATGLDVVLSLFSEGDTYAFYCMEKQGVSCEDVLTYINTVTEKPTASISVKTHFGESFKVLGRLTPKALTQIKGKGIDPMLALFCLNKGEVTATSGNISVYTLDPKTRKSSIPSNEKRAKRIMVATDDDQQIIWAGKYRRWHRSSDAKATAAWLSMS